MIEIRSCEGFDELEACVQLQIETWGYDESDVIPRKTFLIAQSIGGQVMGAFDSEIADKPGSGPAESMVGFVFSLPGLKTGEGAPHAYLHSHMLAVREAYRNRGLGTQLKLAQRREALSRGIRYMEWTFDPLEIKNAFLNIHRLGATVRSYRADFYGVSSSRLQAGLPTDRLVAEWRAGFSQGAGSTFKFGRPPSIQASDRRAHSGSGPNLRVEGLINRQGTGPCRSAGESAQVSAGIFPGPGRTWLRQGCGRERRL